MMKKAAFQKILRQHKNRVFSYATYFLRNREDAEDVTQEVFIKVWNHWEKIDKTRIVAWMMRVTYNQCVDVSRRKKNLVHKRLDSVNFDIEAYAHDSNTTADPESYYEFTETQQAILSAIRELPKKTQSMLLMHYFQGLKYETIGDILDTKVSTVKVAIHRGRKMMRQILADEFPERVGACSDECTVS